MFKIIDISNQMAVRVIWDISPKLIFINFEITPCISEGDFKIEKITRVIYPKSHEQQCDSWLITLSLINNAQSHPRRQIIGVITKQRDDYKTVSWFQNNQLTSAAQLHAKMGLMITKGLDRNEALFSCF